MSMVARLLSTTSANGTMDIYEIEENMYLNEVEEISFPTPRFEKEGARRKPTATSSSKVASNTDVSGNTSKRKLTSSVWNEMVKKTIDGENFALCNHCNKKLKANSSNETKYLHNHLNRCLQRKKQTDIRQCLLSMEKRESDGESRLEIGNWSFNPKSLRQKLAKGIIVHEYSISMFEHMWFKEYISSIQPLVNHISRTTMRK